MEHVHSLRVASTSVHELLGAIDWVIARKAKELVKERKLHKQGTAFMYPIM